VKAIKNDSIDVNFPSNNLTVNIKRFTFTTYDPVSKSIIAKRIQYPLKLGYPPFAGAPKQFSYNMTSLHVHLQLKCSHKMHRLSQDAV
jgi:hypothetical protein